VAVLLRCSTLYMFVEPNGPNYEVPLTARIRQPQPTATALLSNRHFVRFGGLPLGQSAYVLSRVDFRLYDLYNTSEKN